jgi:formate/nitrite transporter FocA (FNT family)
MLGSLLFPIGLVMITLTGADLWTTNIMVRKPFKGLKAQLIRGKFMTTAFLSRRVSLRDVAVSWFVTFFGNLAGSLFSTAILFGFSDVFEETPGYKQPVREGLLLRVANG